MSAAVIIWTVISAIGALAGMFGVAAAWATYRAVPASRRLTRTVAFYQVRRSVLRAVTLLIFFALGIVVLLHPSIAGAWVVWGLVGAVSILTFAEVMDIIDLLFLRGEEKKELAAP